MSGILIIWRALLFTKPPLLVNNLNSMVHTTQKIQTSIATVAAIMVVASFVLLPLTTYAATTVVHPGDMDGWAFAQETATGSGSLVNGPETPPSGTGSAQLVVDSTDGEIIAKAGYGGTKLADITELEYNTYRTSGGSALAIALQLNIDSDVTDENNAWQGRLVYEPYHTQTVSTGEWQTWDTLNDAAGTGTGNWWFSNGTLAANSGCTMATPCTWAEVLAEFPNAGVHNTLGAIVLKAGGGWAGGFDGNVDALTINGDTFDFEFESPEVLTSPSNKDECKKGGWMTFNNPSFKNQGQCVAWTNHNDTSVGEPG